MITRVLDAKGGTLHDCAADGCVVSWDGFVIAGPLVVGGGVDSSGAAIPQQVIATGGLVPGAGAIPPRYTQPAPGVAQLIDAAQG